MAIRRVWAGIVVFLPLAALVLVILFMYFLLWGGEACEVYCGPGGLIGAYGLFFLMAAIWVGGLVLSLIELVRTRARGWWAWLALLLEIAVPLYLVSGLNILGPHA
ncbi:MAG TPA: hypothetical protein VGM70_09450 [Pseudolysinimonas sp.]|jgi:hypothetical protein